jgi:hypothetical protein
MNPGQLPQPYRQSIMRSIIDFESRVYEQDILLADLFPRNIILSLPPPALSDTYKRKETHLHRLRSSHFWAYKR